MEDSAGQGSKQTVTAIAEYDYFAKEDDELDIVKGQIIQNITQKPGGWWEGSISEIGKRGMFPDNFVRVIDNENNVAVLREKSSSVQRRCKAIYSYTQVNEDELSLGVGDIIELLTEVEEGWWRGKLDNKVGVFPSNFVVLVPTSPISGNQQPDFSEDAKSTKTKANKDSKVTHKVENCSEENAITDKQIDTVIDKSDDYKSPNLSSRSIQEFCRVEFPYSPQNNDELGLAIGQIITIIAKELPDKGWWKGEVNGKIGVFPDNFVKLLPINAALEKDIQIATSKLSAKETTKKAISSNLSTLSHPKGFEPMDLLKEFSKKAGIQTGTIAVQQTSLENKIIELIPQSSDGTNRNCGQQNADTKQAIDSSYEKKVPPPLPTKKPAVLVKKPLTHVAGNMLSSLKQKAKIVEQNSTLYQDANDGNYISKFNYEGRRNNQIANSVDEIISGAIEFDKVQRSSILSDIRARRVKAPKRRPPSGTNNLIAESITKNTNLVNEETSQKIQTVSFTNYDDQVKTKAIEWRAQKFPWMNELKASQHKIKPLPCIEPRTSLANNNDIKTQKGKPSCPVTTYLSTEIMNAYSDVPLNKQNTVMSSSSFYESSVGERHIENEAYIIKSTSDTTIDKEIIKHEFEDDKTNPPKSLNSKFDFMEAGEANSTFSHVVMQRNKSPNAAFHEEKKIIELEIRVQRLEASVQIQQDLIADLRKMLQNETNRVELLKNKLDKYTQCVTHV